MTLRVHTLIATATSGGTATVATDKPVNGYVIGLRNDNSWGTATYTLTTPAEEGSGTIYAAAQTNPFTAYTGGSITSVAGVNNAFLGVPCDGYATLTVTATVPSQAGTVYLYTDDKR